MRRGLASLLLCYAAVVSAQVTVPQAVDQARQIPVPNASSLINAVKGAEVVPRYGADTQAQRDLFQGGKGNLPLPGTARTNDCMNKNDPECVAVQLIVTGRGTRPVFTIPANDPMLQFRDNVVKDPRAILGNDPPIVDVPQACSNVIKTLAPTYTTEVCDITVPSSEVSCLQGLEVIVDPDYVYTCMQRLASDQTSTCSIGREVVVDANTLYKCVEQIQTTSAAACTVGRVVTIDADYTYQCDVRPYSVNQYQCTRTLSVTGTPGCTQGALYLAVASDPNGLGQDPCDGGDNIWLSYQCNPGAPPNLYVQTNTKSYGPYGFWLQAWSFDQEHVFENCKGRFYGNTSCTNNNCTTNIIMDVYYITAFGWAYSGSLGKSFNYLSWSLNNVQDQWNSTCTTLEQRSQ